MRKILIILVILLLGYFGYVSFSNGMRIGNAQIISYNDIQNSHSELDKIIQTIETKSAIDFENKKTTLNTSYKDLTELKQTYEERIYKSFSSADTETKKIEIYDIDFLWSRIGAHATNDGVDISLDLAQNSSGTTAVGNYCLCDFYFTVVGEYVDITTFIYHMEDDEELNFSIEEFKILPGSKGLTATFKVPEMPLNKDDLTIIQSSGGLTSTINNSTTSTQSQDTSSTNTTTNTTNTTNTAKTNTTNTTNTASTNTNN